MATQGQTKELAEKTKIVTVFDFLAQKKDLIEKSLPKTITSDRLIGIFNMIIKGSPELAKCTQSSLISAVIQTVQLGLQPGNIGHVYLVPFNNKKGEQWVKEVQLIVGYRGLCELVNRSGKATVIAAEVVKEKDLFEYELGLDPKLKHIPHSGDRGEPIGVYAVAKNLLADEKVFVYLQQEEINKVMGSSKASKSDYSPWKTWPDEMAKKTAVKRLIKLLPLSSDVQEKISADETVKNTISADIPNEPDEAQWNGETIDVGKNEFSEDDRARRDKGDPRFSKPPSEVKENPDGSVQE